MVLQRISKMVSVIEELIFVQKFNNLPYVIPSVVIRLLKYISRKLWGWNLWCPGISLYNNLWFLVLLESQSQWSVCSFPAAVENRTQSQLKPDARQQQLASSGLCWMSRLSHHVNTTAFDLSDESKYKIIREVMSFYDLRPIIEHYLFI